MTNDAKHSHEPANADILKAFAGEAKSMEDNLRDHRKHLQPSKAAHTMDSETPKTDALLLTINEGRVYDTEGPVEDLCRKMEQEKNRLKRALVGLVGAESPEDLREIEAAMRLIPGVDADKNDAINAIHALLSLEPTE